MKNKKIILLICITACILISMSGVFADEIDVLNETICESDIDSQIQVDSEDALASQDDDALSSDFTVYFDASASSDGDGSKSNPYKTYKADRIDYGATAYFSDGVYDITEPISILGEKTTFIGQSAEKTILRFNIVNKFDFTVTPNSNFVLKNLTMMNVHINNQANLVADNVIFRDGIAFEGSSCQALSYASISKKYNSTCGGVIVCDTPEGSIATIDLNDCYFIRNSASSGGVIAAYNSVANIRNCAFFNSSAARFGGAIYSENSNINIYNSYFERNKAKYGGVIYASSSNVYLENSLFNLSEAYSFGGVIASMSSQLDVNHTSFIDSVSLNDAGGAIYSVTGILNVADSLFKNGISDFGGAICNLRTNSSISHTEFKDNEATYYGGSIYNMYGNIALDKNYFINSHAESGGSIFNRISDSFSLQNNNFINSTAEKGPVIFIDGGKVNVVQSGNVYDDSCEFILYGNIYDVDYYQSVPLIDYSAEVPDVLPSSYDSRKYGYVTPAKDQVQGGNCWAFAGIATLEACLKKATGIEYDFSEENVKNLMSEYSLFGSDNEINAGGNLYMFIAYLAAWFGPIYDEYDTYDDFSSLSVIYDSIIHVQNVYMLPQRQNFMDNDYIKRAVMEYGAVSIVIYLSPNEGHAVTIVGWDDEFASNDFLDNKAVGAWIIKNSWGTGWGYDGFGYLSYQQPIYYGYTFIFDDTKGYSNIYQYDFAGISKIHSLNCNEVYLRNQFTAKSDEILSAFSTYFEEPINFTASVYLNGKMVTSQSGYSESGYYTIQFNDEVSLNKGDTFEIEVKLFKDNATVIYIPISTASEISKINFGKGISRYSTNGGTYWQDLYESNSGVACIKAFTRLNNLSEISIDENQFEGNPFGNVSTDDLVSIQLDLPQYYVVDGVQYLLEGLVTFTINGEEYFASVENGKACLNITFDEAGTYNVTVQYKSNRVTSNPVNFTIDVAKTDLSKIVIQADDISKFYGGSEKFVATLLDDGNILRDVNVVISANGKNYTVKTDNNGQAILDLDLPVGVYDVRTEYKGKSVLSKFTVLTTISVNDVTQNVYNAYVSALFLKTDGNALVNTDVVFTMGSYQFNATTDKAGLAVADTTIWYERTFSYLPANNYPMTVINPASGEQKQFTLEVVQSDSISLLSVTQSESKVTITANVKSVYSSNLCIFPIRGYVNFIVAGNVFKRDIDRGVASLELDNLPVGTYNVTAIYSGDSNSRTSSITKEFLVANNPYQLHLGHDVSNSGYEGYYGSSGTIAKITDNNNKGIEGEVVKATILNKTYTSTTDKDGNAIFNLDLDVGQYNVLFEYGGQSLLDNVFVTSSITMADSNNEYLNSKVEAYFINPNNDLNNGGLNVKFIVNGTEYSATTDSNGYACADVVLDVGVYNVTTINLCNGEKKHSSMTIYKTTPEILLTKSKQGSAIVLTANIKQTSAIGNVVFTIGSKKYTSAVREGKAMLAFSEFDEGSFMTYANYIGDANFNNILSDTQKYDFIHTDYELSSQGLSKHYGSSEKFNVTLTNFDVPVSGAVVNILFNGKTYAVKTDSNGIASFNPEANPDSYIVQCSYEEADISSSITIETTIKVTDGGSSNSKVSAIFYDTNGNPLENSNVKFKVANKEYSQTTDEYGLATLDADLGLERGTYEVSIINPVSGETEYSTLTVTKSTPSLSFSVVRPNGADILKAVLPKDAQGTIRFDFGEGLVYDPEIIDGVALVEGLDPGDYDVNVTYYGDDNYNMVSKPYSFTITKAIDDPIIRLDSAKITTTYGTSKSVTVILTDSEDNPLAGRTITLRINNVNCKGTTKDNGKVAISIPNNLAVKTYTATITFAGDEDHLAKTSSVTVVVNKATPKLTAAKKTFKVNVKTKKYVVTLKTDKNKVYKNQKVTIKVKGKTYTAKTNSKGKATFKITKLTKKGTFTATVKFAGNSYYKAVSKKVKITVKK